jgi:hypothetical protein
MSPLLSEPTLIGNDALLAVTRHLIVNALMIPNLQ